MRDLIKFVSHDFMYSTRNFYFWVRTLLTCIYARMHSMDKTGADSLTNSRKNAGTSTRIRIVVAEIGRNRQHL